MLYPQQGMRRQSVLTPGCPDFGEDSVLNRGPEGHSPPGGSVRPGLHHPSAAGPDVVWWDPAVLPPEPEEHAPLRNQRVLEADTAGAAAASEANYASWKQARETLLAQASHPTLKVQTITSLARKEGEGVAESDPESKERPHVRVETVADTSSKRPGGKRFGALVHAVLASINFSEVDTVQQSAAMNGRLIGATDEEIEAAIAAVRAALEHPLLRRAAARPQSELRRESPVLMRLEDGSLAEGVIDLAYSENEPNASWIVVDFKTDREFAASSERYVAQVRLYAAAISSAMNSPAQGVLLVV